MSKEKTAYVCTECGYDSAKWLGRCPNCGAWDTFKEVRLGKAPVATRQSAVGSAPSRQVRRLSEIEHGSEQRIDTLDGGGGLVKGSLVLLGGEPGIGKSTLLLQTVLRMTGLRVLYVSGEESEQQIKMRADRLLTNNSKLLTPHSSLLTPNSSLTIPDSLFILCETSLERIYEQAEAISPDLIVIDSIQAISSDQGEAFPGSVTQVRDSAVSLLRYVKETGRSVILVGHITKEGSLAGPKVLEHIVDTVLHFEGDRHYMYRVLRGLKNRFGSTSELGIYEMQQNGLRQVSNPSELLLTQDRDGLSGIAITSAIEGIRPFLVETQALVSTAAYGTPQRSATGFDQRRLNMLLAVLEKRVGFKLAQKDVFVNIAGGLRVTDLAMDLSVIAAVLSSNVDTPIESGWCMAGEVGLSGEVRPVNRIEQRIAEAEKLGFTDMIIPKYNLQGFDQNKYSIRLHPVRKVEEALRALFG